MSDERRERPPHVEGATDGDTLGTSGPHTHPVSAPHEFAPESGTPAFSKGHAVPEPVGAQRRGEDAPSGGEARPDG
jgi:hypothetical protein